MNDNVKELIKSGNFKRVKALIENDETNLLEQIVLELGFNEGGIEAYTFVFRLLTVNERIDLTFLR